MISAEPDFDRDLVLLLEACTAGVDVEVLQAVRAAAGSVRHADGYVFQHLLDGPITPSELARRLGVSQQAASKQVADMAARGLVLRGADPNDARSRLVTMSERGHRAVEAGRVARARISSEVAALLGPRRNRELLTALAEVGAARGALAAMAGRQIRPESSR